jgi:hypothetical protein
LTWLGGGGGGAGGASPRASIITIKRKLRGRSPLKPIRRRIEENDPLSLSQIVVAVETLVPCHEEVTREPSSPTIRSFPVGGGGAFYTSGIFWGADRFGDRRRPNERTTSPPAPKTWPRLFLQGLRAPSYSLWPAPRRRTSLYALFHLIRDSRVRLRARAARGWQPAKGGHGGRKDRVKGGGGRSVQRLPPSPLGRAYLFLSKKASNRFYSRTRGFKPGPGLSYGLLDF